jgi:hypothetical protein
MGSLGVLGAACAAALVLIIVRSRRRAVAGPGDLGTVTSGWLAEHKAGKHHDQAP